MHFTFLRFIFIILLVELDKSERKWSNEKRRLRRQRIQRTREREIKRRKKRTPSTDCSTSCVTATMLLQLFFFGMWINLNIATSKPFRTMRGRCVLCICSAHIGLDCIISHRIRAQRCKRTKCEWRKKNTTQHITTTQTQNYRDKTIDLIYEIVCKTTNVHREWKVKKNHTENKMWTWTVNT